MSAHTRVSQRDGLEEHKLLLLQPHDFILLHQLEDGVVEVEQPGQPGLLLVHDVVLGVHQLVLQAQRAEHDPEDQDLHPGALQQAHLVGQREGGEACEGGREEQGELEYSGVSISDGKAGRTRVQTICSARC